MWIKVVRITGLLILIAQYVRVILRRDRGIILFILWFKLLSIILFIILSMLSFILLLKLQLLVLMLVADFPRTLRFVVISTLIVTHIPIVARVGNVHQGVVACARLIVDRLLQKLLNAGL